jgi:hypothetical protein
LILRDACGRFVSVGYRNEVICALHAVFLPLKR